MNHEICPRCHNDIVTRTHTSLCNKCDDQDIAKRERRQRIKDLEEKEKNDSPTKTALIFIGFFLMVAMVISIFVGTIIDVIISFFK